jgi:16S rRNA (guanine527-N7)-methyltransferase
MSGPGHRLNQLLTAAGSPPLTEEHGAKFAAYLVLLQKWNSRTNLTAIRDEEGILSRHFLESILAARLLPKNVSNLLDFGSGAGFPGLPIAILRPEISVTLAESQHKKAAFLREAIRTLGMHAKVHAARAEDLTERFDCVTLRAVDKMQDAIPAAIRLLAPGGCLALLTTTRDAPALRSLASESGSFAFRSEQSVAPGTDRVLLIGVRQSGSAHSI